MPPRQSVSSVARVRTASDASPASGRRSSSPIAAERSAAATSRHWDDVRTLWSRRSPVSQSGYQSRSARTLTASPRRPSWSRTRSRSLAGPASRRATLPATASANPPRRPRPLPGSARPPAGHAADDGERNPLLPLQAAAGQRPLPGGGEGPLDEIGEGGAAIRARRPDGEREALPAQVPRRRRRGGVLDHVEVLPQTG